MQVQVQVQVQALIYSLVIRSIILYASVTICQRWAPFRALFSRFTQ